MRAKWLRVAWLASAVAGCGQGHVIFNVDVYSFIKGTGQDTIPYFVVTGTDSASSTPQRIDLPGVGSSFVDSILVNGKVNFENDSGAGTIGLQMYLAGDSAGTFNSSALALTVPDAAVSGNGVTPDTIVGRLNAAVLQLFTGRQVWVRFQARGTNPGLTLLAGKAVFKTLWLTVVVNDKFF
jgi:hypothetical protein